ncbi:MAG TPA: MIP family channel protein [Acidimicrobiales bacterium]|nr:MIP family channel protein [Acidimicrobiales bacterium]
MTVTTRKVVAEAAGTFFLVFFAVGVATLSFGFGITGSSRSAGVAATAFAFGLVLMGLAYAIGPISGCHVNPAVTLGFVLSGRMTLSEAVEYWVAQFIGGIAGALALWGVVSGSPGYSRSITGLGADGYNSASMVHLHMGAAFGAEVILTFLFVFVILAVTSKIGAPGFAGIAIGLTLTVVHLIGIPLTGTSVNPARSLGPALVVRGLALSQVWLFIVAPMVGGAVAALLYRVLIAETPATAAAEATIVPEVSAPA